MIAIMIELTSMSVANRRETRARAITTTTLTATIDRDKKGRISIRSARGQFAPLREPRCQ
jgi:hypothetical protein